MGTIPSVAGLFYFLLLLKIVLYDPGCMFGLVVELQNHFGTDQMPPGRYSEMDKNLNI